MILLTQLNLYTEEKFEDEEDMRERTQHLLRETNWTSERPRSESEVARFKTRFTTRQCLSSHG
jgi:hypothetical protein